jgi:hypothetical protein
MHMERVNVSKAILAGFIATLIMTIMAYAAPMMGMPKMDFGAMLGSVVNDGQAPAPMSGTWWFGMIWHFINGSIIFALIYAYLLYPALSGSPWVRGAIWGIVLWFLSQAIVMPMLSYGLFSTRIPEGMKTVVGSLIGHIIYGAVLGAIAVPHAEHLPYTGRPRPA